MRIAEVPSEVQGTPFANAYIVFKLLPAKTYSEKIAVSNTTNSAMNVNLYPASATYVKGVFAPMEKVLPDGLASWTTVDPKFAKLPAHSEIVVTVTIKVPATAISSQQYGIIWAATSTSPNSNALGGVSRVGIRMYDQVGEASPVSTSSPSTGTVVDKTNWISDHLVGIEWIGVTLLFLFVFIIGAISVRRERRRAEKRRRKQKE
jgi:hypothetical protein